MSDDGRPPTREERKELLADLRAAGVKSVQVSPAGDLLSVEFFPAGPALVAPDENRPLPPPERTDDEKLFNPLGIGKKAGKG